MIKNIRYDNKNCKSIYLKIKKMMKSSEICGESAVETSKHFKKFQVTMSSAL